MIKYKLTCKECKKSFDSWFSSSKEFERLKKMKLLNCNFCDSFKVEKSLMAPNVINNIKENSKSKNYEREKLRKLKKEIRKYQNYIKNNLEYVGEKFTFEARSIHYNSKKKTKGIYGKATMEQLKELQEEGIETQSIPWIEDNEN
tara:strand:+ start:157 stop:591 length:435 start_codon:yes stop_codon:yes gene_type:complete